MADIRNSHMSLVIISIMAMALMVGCSSDSEDLLVPVVDTVPPAIPGGMDAALSTDGVSINWTANVSDADLAGYIVYRSNDDQNSFRPLHAGVILSSSWTDDYAHAGQTYFYKVSAVDSSDNESAFSQVFEMSTPSDAPWNPQIKG